jgi:hypothetical protein
MAHQCRYRSHLPSPRMSMGMGMGMNCNVPFPSAVSQMGLQGQWNPCCWGQGTGVTLLSEALMARCIRRVLSNAGLVAAAVGNECHCGSCLALSAVTEAAAGHQPCLLFTSAMVLLSAARVPADGLLACDIRCDVTVNVGGSWYSRIGVGVV